ncbi:tetratricopeptide repeat protein [Hyalangium sp.]|uniref:nSTAND1 domain-containing NTPase n=1 Tax=Hyalangium sp. TaxID=2028555 RepID=UPI002D68F612|nr:tetratricopeptide repeat protein [Hyalangium sp.]HYH97204.1 tetratricopeptide repeat protein [Hyalangium sp.]
MRPGAGEEQALNELREAYSQRSLVVFAGAALSTAARLPSWAKIVSALADLPGMNQAPAHREEMLAWLQSGKLVDALSVAARILGRLKCMNLIEEMLDDQSLPVPPLAQAIAALSPRLKAVLTTNLDHTLEHAFGGYWPCLWTVPDGLYQQRRFILKLHGTLLDRSSWVFTRDDYDQATWGHRGSQKTLERFFSSFPVLFVGHDLESEDLSAVLSQVRALAGDHPPRNFALVPSGTVQGQRRLNLERAGIHLIEYANPDGQHTQARQFLAAIAGTPEAEVSAVASGAPSPVPAPTVSLSEESPFPGLESFDEHKAHLFFGRDTEISAALQKLGNTPEGHERWLQVEGASGAGKSSFARAGLLHKVRLGGWVGGASERWSVAELRPGRQPLLSLAQAVFKALRPEGASLDEFFQQLSSSETALTNFVRQHAPAGSGFLLLVDQFEELCTLAEKKSVEGFARCLAAALKDTGVPFYLVTAIRSDFSEHLGSMEQLAPLLQTRASRYTLPPMSPVGFRAAITKPAELGGGRWQAGLPERLLEDVSSIESGLPLLAHALLVLWEGRSGHLLTHKTYDDQGGILGSLTGSADQLLGSLGAEGKDHARRLLLALVTSQGGKVSRRSLTRAEALEAAGGDNTAWVLTRLSGGRSPAESDTAPAPVRLIVATQAEGQDRVDLVHEALLMRWATFRRWIEEARPALELRGTLESAARLWESTGSLSDNLPSGGRLAYLREASPITYLARQFLRGAEKRERRRRQTLAAIGAFILIGLVFVSGLAFYALRQRALAQQRLAEALAVADQVVFAIDRKLAPLSGTAQVRKELLESSSKLLEALRAGAQDNAVLLRIQLAAHQERGDLESSHNNLEQARQEFDAGLEIARQLEAQAPNSFLAKYDLSVILQRLGKVAREQGRLDEARSLFQQALGLWSHSPLTEAPPDFVQRDLWVIPHGLGDVALQQGRLDEARFFFEESLGLIQVIVKAAPYDDTLEHDLSLTLYKLGNVALHQGRLDEARSFSQQSLSLIQLLAKAEPSKASLQYDLSVILHQLGSVAERQGRLDEARSFLQQAFDLTQSLAKTEPSKASLQYNLSGMLHELGNVAERQGHLDEAHSFLQQALDLTQSLANAAPLDTQSKMAVIATEFRLAMLAISTKDPHALRIHRANAERLLDELRHLEGRSDYQTLRDILSVLPR